MRRLVRAEMTFVAVNDESYYTPVTEFTTVGLGADEIASILAESVAQ